MGNTEIACFDRNPSHALGTKSQAILIFHCFLFLLVLRCFTSQGSLLAPSYGTDILHFCKMSFLIRKPSDQRLLDTSPTLIAAKPRPSSPFETKASTIRSCFLLGNLRTTLTRYQISDIGCRI